MPAVKAAVKAGLGVTARPVEMMSPDLRVLGNDGLPAAGYGISALQMRPA
jgi:DNA-binding transcriptional LysR family regulator